MLKRNEEILNMLKSFETANASMRQGEAWALLDIDI
jgi:hypothetical protein